MRARVLGSLVLLFALALPALAQDRRGAPSLDRVLPQIRRSVPGTFYDAEGPFLSPDGRASYRIKWMTPDGRIIWFAVDARSGRVLGGAWGGPPSSRGRDDDGRGGWGNNPNNWRQDDDRGNDWGNGGGTGWGNGSGRGGDDRGNGWNGEGRGDDGRGGDGRRGDDRGNGWGGRNGDGGRGGDNGGKGHGGDNGGKGHGSDRHHRNGG